MTSISPGIYKHYKGPLYQVLHTTAHDADYEGREVVVYIGLQLDGAKTGPRIAVRTASTFEQLVHVDDGTPCGFPYVCRNDLLVAVRFDYLGPVFEPWMMEVT